MNLLKDYSVDGGFLQSEQWRKFKEKTGLKTFFVGDENFNASILEHKISFGLKYFFIPRGPIFNLNIDIKKSINDIVQLAKKNNISWIRIEPQTYEDLEKIKKILGKNKIIKSAKNHQPAQTLMINLKESEDEIFSKMKKSTRYDIRLSDKTEVDFFQTRSDNDIEMFLDLLKNVSERHNIVGYPRKYYYDLFNSFNQDIFKLYVAKLDKKVLAGMLVSSFSNNAIYLYGASSNELRNLKAMSGLHWFVIKEIKKEGFLKFDLGGTKIIKDKNGKNIPALGSWNGFSRAKLGFCPKCEPVEFPGCYDIVLDNKKYFFYRFGQKLKSIKREIMKKIT